MKKIYLLLVTTVLISVAFSQNNVGINNPTPDPSAALDITATDMGLLIPRMTTSERINITSPANGLLVFDTDTRGFWFYDTNATTWKSLNSAGSNYSIYDSDGDTFISVEENPDDDTARIYIAGTEKFRFSPKGIEVVNTGNSVFIGEGAGKNDDLNNNKNVAIGTAALENSTDRSGLVAIGDSALFNNGIGAVAPFHSVRNIALGYKALFSNTTGYRNTAIGFNSLYSNISGMRNFAGGASALFSNTGNSNTAVGNECLFTNGTGNRNTANGSKTLYSNSSGSFNTAMGFQALYENTTGYSNIAIGINTLKNNTDRSNLVAIGDSALFNNGIGTVITGHATYNLAVGSKSLFENTIGRRNTAIGHEALYSNINGSNNTSIGYQSLNANNGSDNFAGGFYSLFSNNSGIENTAIGSNSLIQNDGGSQNVAVGYLSMAYNISGHFNTAIGHNAGAGSFYSSLSNTTAIGNETSVSADNQIRLGNSSVISIGGYAAWTNLSDGRFKNNIQENVAGLDFILKLRPITYNLNVEKIDNYLGIPDSLRNNEILVNAAHEKEAIIQTGFIAQEVEQAAQSLGYDFSGVDAPKNEHDFYGLRYAEFVVPIIKGIQEQQAMIEELKQIIEQQNEKIKELNHKIEN
jgi:hypothetical protein